MEDATDLAGGIHEMAKATNLWFEREVVVLERDACTLAADWAGKGLPRHDVARTAPLEVEQFLAGRCAETFRQWTDRVRVTMRDRIAREAESIGDKLVELRASTTRIERLEGEIAGVDRRVQDLRLEAKEAAARVGFDPIFPGWLFFWFFAIALTVVEFFANFPVFRLLLPMKPALAKAAEDAAQDAISGDWWAGLALQMKEIVLHADALFVALIAVLVLVLFGKTMGGIRSRARHAQAQGSAARRDDRSEHPATTPDRADRMCTRHLGRAHLPIYVRAAASRRWPRRALRAIAWRCNGSRPKRCSFRREISAPWRDPPPRFASRRARFLRFIATTARTPQRYRTTTGRSSFSTSASSSAPRSSDS